jgi:hypothetical protein
MKKSLVLTLACVLAIGAVACKPKATSTADVPTPPKQDVAANPASIGDLLTNYKSFADQYVAAAQKAKTGDMSAIQSLPGLNKTAQDWAQKIQTAYASMTPDQQKQAQDILTSIKNAVMK